MLTIPRDEKITTMVGRKSQMEGIANRIFRHQFVFDVGINDFGYLRADRQ
jgi:hypothetical protein